MQLARGLLILLLGVFGSVARADCIKSLTIQPDNPPRKLSETGLFEDLQLLKPCDSVVEYNVNSPLWSDGASKRRWIVQPKNIGFQADDPWIFPKGTILVKHFELQSSSTQKIRVETRLLMSADTDEWYGYSYQWQDDQKDAILLDDAATKEFQVFSPNNTNGTRKQVWSYPSQQACLQCHNSWSGYVLGPRTEQINKDISNSPNQLDQWNGKSYFSSKIESASKYKKYAPLTDTSQSLETRAKSYLATNCAQCHQPESPVRTQIDFRFKTPLASMNLINHIANADDMGIPGGVIVKPGKKELSILWLRLTSKSTLRMPPLGSNEPDQDAIDLIGKWIDELTPSKAKQSAKTR